MTLAEQLQTLIDTNGLRSLSIHINARGDGTAYFGAYAHGSLEAPCGYGHDDDCPRKAALDAIASLNAKRFPSELEAA